MESASANYSFTNHTFTTCGTTGTTGPSITACRSAYSTTWDENASFFTVTGGIQYWVVPVSGLYRIEAAGAKGGNGNSGTGGAGARMIGDFNLTGGETIRILVGQSGGNHPTVAGGVNATGGGGGGTFVVRTPFNTNAAILVVAGGGGGSGSSTGGGPGQITTSGQAGLGPSSGAGGISGGGGGGATGGVAGTASADGGTGASCSFGSGGGGFFTNGGPNCNGSTPVIRGLAFVGFGGSGGTADSARSGSTNTFGGFGGGAGSGHRAPGGGGYSGGGGDGGTTGGGGGGSYNSGSNQSNTAGFNSGDGYVTITSLGPAVSSFAPTSSLTNSTTLTYNLVFTQSVTDLATNDFSLSGTGSAACTFATLSGSGTTYEMQLTGCSPGTVTLTLAQNAVQNSSSQTGPSTATSAATVTIDRTAPTVSSVTAPSNGTYSPTGNPTGSALAFSVRMDESVTVTTSGGTPSLEVTIGSTTRSATYISQSDSRTLTFRYLIASSTSDIDTDGIALSSTLSLNGGVIADLAGNALTNTSLTATQALPSLTNILVAQRATAPTITSIDAGNTQLSINFTAGANNGSAITNYKYSLNGGSFTAFSPVDTTTPLVISGLANGTSYAVRILAMTGVGDGESSTAVTATPTAIVVGGGSNITTSFGRIETSTAFTASGGTSPYTFSLSPTVSGISINTSTGVVTTSSTLATGTYSTNVIATDSGSRSGQKPITVTVGKASPTFSSWSNVTKTFGDSPYTITAPTVTGSIAGSFTYTSSNPAVISINTSTATVVAAGTATITALFTPSDTSNYETATTTNTVTVNKATQTITFASLTDKTLGMGTFTISATSSSGLTVSFISVDTTRCTIATATVTLLAAGTCTISASQAGDSNYDSATVVTRSFTISPTLNITTPNSGLSGSYNAAFTLTLSISGGSGGATFSLASGTLPSGLSLNGSSGVISGTATSAGSRTITIQVSDSNGATATTSAFTITISQLTPTVSLALTGGVTSTPIGVAITITATVSQPGSLAFKVAGSTISGCSAVASSAGSATCSWTPASLGNASLTAELSPTDSTNYSSATSSTLTITVVTASTTITLTVTGGAITKGASRSIVASTTDVAGKVTFRINGRVIRGCVNRSVASAQATCNWRVALHGSQTLSATFNPTNNAYQNSTTSMNVVAVRRTGRS